MKKPVYIRCPRCELNYIQKKDKYCSVCKAEMEAKKDLEDDIDLELCPICKTNYIQQDEIMCASCLKEHRNEDGEDNDDWNDYMVDDSDDMIDDDDMSGVDDLADSTLLDDELTADMEFGDEEDADVDFSDDDEEMSDIDDDDDFDDLKVKYF